MSQQPVTYGTVGQPQGYPPQGYPPQGYAAGGAPPTTPEWYNPPTKQQDLKEITDMYNNQWEGPLLTAGCRQPLWFLFGCFCSPCASFVQRKKLLMIDRDPANWQYYQCCAGIWGESMTQQCNSCTRNHACFCLALETFCCLACSVHGNRFMIQVHYGLENTCCDVFLFWLACICQVLVFIFQLTSSSGSPSIPQGDSFNNLADLLIYMLMGCMMAQHEDEMVNKGYPVARPVTGVPVPQMA